MLEVLHQKLLQNANYILPNGSPTHEAADLAQQAIADLLEEDRRTGILKMGRHNFSYLEWRCTWRMKNIRARVVHRWPAGVPLPETLTDDHPIPENIVITRQEAGAVQRYIAALPPRQAKVARLLMAGFSSADIARKMGISRAAVSQIKLRLRLRFKLAGGF